MPGLRAVVALEHSAPDVKAIKGRDVDKMSIFQKK